MLYRGMDRAQRDIAYNNTLAVPERGEIVADWAARSDLMRQKYGGVLDLRCGHPARAARLVSRRRPESADAGLHPLRLLAGERQGGLRFPGRGDIVARDFALIEYTLPPAARLDRIVAEIRRAALWLAEHLGDYGADPGELYVSGHSAGGYLTAMTMPLDLVRGGIAISGIYDLEPIRLNYLNERLGLSPAEADCNSPLLHFPPQAAELVIAYGTRELPELCHQSIEYAPAWIAHGLSGRLLPIDGANHFTILAALALADGTLTCALLDMIDG